MTCVFILHNYPIPYIKLNPPFLFSFCHAHLRHCHCLIDIYLQDPPDWQEILKYFRGSELQNYFTKVLEDNLKALIKPQYVDHIPRAIKGKLTVSQMLDSKLELDNKQKMCDELELNEVLSREVSQLSGGELQRFAIAMSCIQRADVCVTHSSIIGLFSFLIISV